VRLAERFLAAVDRPGVALRIGMLLMFLLDGRVRLFWRQLRRFCAMNMLST
jgi:hypothetical protein